MAGIVITDPMGTIFGVDWLQALLSSFPVAEDPIFDSYWITIRVFNILPPTSLNCEVMKVRFSSEDRMVFGKNNKHKVSEPRKQLNELKVEFLALILVPFRAPNSQ